MLRSSLIGLDAVTSRREVADPLFPLLRRVFALRSSP
jgi:hypothetical protein